MTVLPAEVGTGRVWCDNILLVSAINNGQPSVSKPDGVITFTPMVRPWVADSKAAAISLPKPSQIKITAGSFVTYLLATDDPTSSPQGWTYLVTVELDGWRRVEMFSIEVPQGSNRNLADISPALSSTGIPVTKGVSIASAVVDVNAHLVITMSDGSTIDAGVVSESGQATLNKLLTVDGSGSGLDADLLDGKQASAFANATVASASATDLNTLTTAGSYTLLGGGGTTALHYPADGVNGFLSVVSTDADNVAQRYAAGPTTDSRVWERTKIGGTWGNWYVVGGNWAAIDKPAVIAAGDTKENARNQIDAVPGVTTANKANPDDFVPDTLLKVGVGGTGVQTYSGYFASGHIPVTPGQTVYYNGRHLLWFSDIGVCASSAFPADNTTYNYVSAVAPANAKYCRVDWPNSNMPSAQVNVGSSAPFDKYGYRTPYLATTGGMAARTELTAVGNDLVVTGYAGRTTTDLFRIAMRTIPGTANELLNYFQTTNAANKVIHSDTDGITPIRTQMGTVGANHGYPCVAEFANPDGKTVADLGSVWTDGTREYVLLGFTSAGKLVIGGSYTVDAAGVVSSAVVAPKVNLTHVSGATHTGAIVYTTMVASQLYPSVGNVRLERFIDGAPAQGNGTWSGTKVSLRESYTVLDYRSIYDTAKANIGTSYTTKPVAGAVQVVTQYAFTGPTCRISTQLFEIAPTNLGQCGFVQSMPLTALSGGSVTRYVPGVLPDSGFDFAAGVPMATYATTVLINQQDIRVPGIPPTFSLEAHQTGGVTDHGYAIGYLPYGSGDQALSVRKNDSLYWDLRSTKKNYPNVFSSRAAGWGTVSVEAFRIYLTGPQTDRLLGLQDALPAWAALDAVIGVS